MFLDIPSICSLHPVSVPSLLPQCYKAFYLYFVHSYLGSLVYIFNHLISVEMV